MSNECEHNWRYQGIVFKNSEYNSPGSGAKIRRYYERYYCSKCLENLDKPIGNQDTSYQEVKYNATPG